MLSICEVGCCEFMGGFPCADVCSIGKDLWENRIADACGIVAFIGNEPASPYLLEGLHILQNRGYDSAGVTTVDSDVCTT